jgi:hypothetical protein
MRKYFLIWWVCIALSLSGCAWLRSQYKEGPNGEPSNVAQVQAAVRGLPYGGIIDLGLSLVGAVIGGGAVHTHHKRKQKKAKATVVPA